MIIKIRNWYDIIFDGGDGQSGRLLGSIAPYINVNTAMSSGRKILSVIYYDVINNLIRRGYGRDPYMEFGNLTTPSGLINGLVGNSFTTDYTMNTYFYFDSTNLYCYCTNPSATTTIDLSTLNGGGGNNLLKKCITQNYSLYLFSNGSSIYYLNNIISENFIPIEIVADYNGTYYDCYIDDNSGTYYLNYTTTNATKIVSFTNTISDLIDIGTLADVTNSYIMSKVFYFNNNVSIYLKKSADTNVYEGKIDISNNIYITKKFKNLIEFKPTVYNNNISLIGIDGSSNLVNCSVYTGNTFNLNNKVPVTSFDITSISDETYIYYVGTDNLLHQLWNPIMFYKIKINDYVTSLTGTITSFGSSINPVFATEITDYVLNTNSVTDSVTFTININSVDYTGIGYPGQNIQINDLSNNNYYIKLSPPNLISGYDVSIFDQNYIPGYYLVADTNGNSSPYYTILDCYGCPVWYSVNTSQPGQGNTNPRPCSLALGKGNNRIIKNIFDGTLAREYIDINTLQQQNYKILTDGSGGSPQWDVHDALELSAPPDRAGNIFIMSYYIGFYLQEIKPIKSNNNVTLLNNEFTILQNIDYTNLIKLNGIGTCDKVKIFSNYSIGGTMAENTIFNITYHKVSANAPDTISIYLQSVDSQLLCTINNGSQINITSLIYISDIWYTDTNMFQVEEVTFKQIVWEWWSTDYFNTQDNEFFHINSNDIHPVTGNIVISCRTCSSIICIEYSTKNILWVIDSDGQLAAQFKDSSNVKFLIPTGEPNIAGSDYYGVGLQHDARWHIDIDPLTPGNDIVSIYDDETGNRRPRARGVIYEIDLTNNLAIFRSNVYHDSTNSGYMGSYNIVKEDNNSYSHVLDWVQMHPCLQEFAGDSVGMGTQTLLYQMDLPGDHYRIIKAKPSEMSIEAMRRTSGLPFSTPTPQIGFSSVINKLEPNQESKSQVKNSLLNLIKSENKNINNLTPKNTINQNSILKKYPEKKQVVGSQNKKLTIHNKIYNLMPNFNSKLL